MTSSDIDETTKGLKRPSCVKLDEILLESTFVEQSNQGSSLMIGTFFIHDEHKIEEYVRTINTYIGENVYATYPELNHLGIVLNTKVGYLIHINSITTTKGNIRFTLSRNTTAIIKNIIQKCHFGKSEPTEVKLALLWIKLLFEENSIKIKNGKYVTFDVKYCLSLQRECDIGRREIATLNVLCHPDPLLPILLSFQCNLCFRSFSKKDGAIRHFNTTHTNQRKLPAKNFVSKSFSQNTPKGLITVLMSTNYINQLKYTHSKDQAKTVKRYKVTKISSNDEMFKSNYIIKFVNKLDVEDYNYYLNYCQTDSKFYEMFVYIKKIMINILIINSKSYKYNNRLVFHKTKILKFYLSDTKTQLFNFSKLSNYEKIMAYAESIARVLIIILASFNLKHKIFPTHCSLPDYKPLLTDSQDKLVSKIFIFLKEYCKTHIQVITENESKDVLFKGKLDKSSAFFWSLISELFIEISTQPSSESTLLQTIFTFSICSFEKLDDTLTFSRPSRRKTIFQSLLYIIRLSFLDKVTYSNDKELTIKVAKATRSGELRKIMEKMYYPTMYYFLRKKTYNMKPFFNPDKYTYVHPVVLKEKFVGCKILGLYSLNLMIQRIELFLDSEIPYASSLQVEKKSIRHVTESQFKREFETDIMNKELSEGDEILQKSVSCITCLLIGYLALTCNPLSKFSDYLDLDFNCLLFENNIFKIQIQSSTFLIREANIISYFKEYLKLRKIVLKTDTQLDKSKLFINLLFVKSQTFLDLMSCNYTDYKSLYSFLKEAQSKCRNDSGNRGNNRPNWMELVRTQRREKSEGFLVVNLKLIAPEYQQFVLDKDSGNVDRNSYISCDDEINLNELIENGFFESRMDSNDLESDDVECDVTFDFTEYSEADTSMIDSDYTEMMKYIKAKNLNLQNKRVKI